MPAAEDPATDPGPDENTDRRPGEKKPGSTRRRVVTLVAVAALLATVFSVAVATRSGKGDATGGRCPVEALTCAADQSNTIDSATPSATATTEAGGGAQTSGISRPTPAPSASATAKASAKGGTDGTDGKSPAGGHCAGFAACGFPDARSTGPRLPMKPHNTGALTVDTDGTVINRWDITGSLDIYANNVTVIDSRITSANWWGINLRSGFSGLRILHTTITAVPGKGPDNGGVDYAVSNMGTSSIEVGWCDVSIFGDALSMGQGNLHDNYVHDVTPFKNLGGEWQHTNAVISDGGGSGGLVIRHNTLLNPTPVDQGASGSIGLFSDTGAVLDVTVQDNWLAGGAYALYAGGTGAAGIKVTGNIFSTQYHPGSGGYGPVAAWNAGGAGNVWSDNYMSDGTPVTPKAGT